MLKIDYKSVRQLRRKYDIPKARQVRGPAGYGLHFGRNHALPYSVPARVGNVENNEGRHNGGDIDGSMGDGGQNGSMEGNQGDIQEDGWDGGFNDIVEDCPSTNEPCEYDSMKERIYSGSNITHEESSNRVLCLLLKYNLPLESVSAILDCINAHLPAPLLTTSKYKFYKNAQVSLQETEKFFFCENSKCTALLGKNLTGQVECAKCGEKIMIRDTTSYFASLGIKKQLEKFLSSSPEIYDDIRSQWMKLKIEDSGSIKDVFHGSVYQNLLKESHRPFITLTFCSDGFEAQKCGNSLWPFLFCLNEIKKERRFRNLFLGGIWQGNGSAPATSIMALLVDQLNDVALRGLKFNHRGKVISLPVFTICAVLDSPARCKFAGLAQFNGFYGCIFCYERGIRLNHTTIYPCAHVMPPLRTEEEYEIDLLAISEKNKEESRGVRVMSPLQQLYKFSVVNNITVDSMHGFLLGVMKGFEPLWFNKKNRKEDFSLFHRMPEINAIYLNFKPPSFVSRRPTKSSTVSDFLEWKANQFRNFVYFYSVALLQPFMKRKYFLHYLLFVRSIWTLSQNSISREELERCRADLIMFVQHYQNLYGLQAMTSNVHLLLHVCDAVEKFGPLWAHNMFSFESFHMTLGKYVQGPRNAQTQIVQKYLLSKSLLWRSDANDSISSFDYSTPLYHDKNIHTMPLGKSKLTTLNPCDTNDSNLATEFNRLNHKGIRYSTKTYHKDFKFENDFVQLKTGQFAIIERILQTESKELYLLCQLLNVQKFCYENFLLDYFFKIVSITDLRVNVKVDEIHAQCVHLTVNDVEYITYPPNNVEMD